MTRNEIIDLVDKYTGICDIVFSEELADALIPRIEQEKKDTLKEFVEWAINCVSVGNDISECKTLATSLTTDADTREFCAKRYAAFSQYSSGLRFALEQFLKMKGIKVDK